MRHKFLLLLTIFLALSCDNSTSDRNPYLVEPKFSYDINLNLPQYGNLNTPGSAIYIGGTNVGIKGIIVINQGFGNFLAWEASCPNHTPSACSTMKIEGGVNCRCSCDDYLYSLVNGAILSELPEGERAYGLLNYQVTGSGTILRVSN
ncbi:hypothetical protein [Robertkochia solimangrovi]|uniref:hypothetical protein n=1 Tax=Robertkochia solimangrovi TaxID=2213046 RepID=UPI00117F9CC4|nr:hypothetical protein [Robertkochia solimangrovi]TRZ46405.1 hypothetical protein DMZ48_03910 [Robertkochia solimangrovi]